MFSNCLSIVTSTYCNYVIFKNGSKTRKHYDMVITIRLLVILNTHNYIDREPPQQRGTFNWTLNICRPHEWLRSCFNNFTRSGLRATTATGATNRGHPRCPAQTLYRLNSDARSRSNTVAFRTLTCLFHLDISDCRVPQRMWRDNEFKLRECRRESSAEADKSTDTNGSLHAHQPPLASRSRRRTY